MSGIEAMTLSSPLGPVSMSFGDLRFLDPGTGRTYADLDDFDETQLLRCYLIPLGFSTPSGSYACLPSVVALAAELLRAMKAVARGEASTLYLVDDAEFTLQLDPVHAGHGMWQVQCLAANEVLWAWLPSEDRLLFELAGLLQSLRWSCAQAQLPIEQLLQRCPGELDWRG